MALLHSQKVILAFILEYRRAAEQDKMEEELSVKIHTLRLHCYLTYETACSAISHPEEPEDMTPRWDTVS